VHCMPLGGFVLICFSWVGVCGKRTAITVTGWKKAYDILTVINYYNIDTTNGQLCFTSAFRFLSSI